jgi:hypothetical protein
MLFISKRDQTARISRKQRQAYYLVNIAAESFFQKAMPSRLRAQRIVALFPLILVLMLTAVAVLARSMSKLPAGKFKPSSISV